MSASRLLKPALIGLLMAAAPLTALPAFAQTAASQPMPTTLRLTATGEESAAPDMATVTFAVVTQGATASSAMQDNNVRMNAVMAALKKAGIEARDIQTSSLNLNPQYDYKDGQAPKLTGYQAQDQITVRVNDTARTGPVVDAVIGAGINQINSIDFGLKDDSVLRDQARKDAVANLRQRAQLYADATGMKLGRLLTLEEGSTSTITPPRPMMMMKAASDSTPVASGELQLSVQVSATYELQ
ncbi:SIMPL domain-containing protein [Asticcacaulis sp. EMRT-3]|uniref:SIMPL domain-containing protein n=1 Tax=Asticcacaulis sp. EMRT-3 TaxID=3040349 RepID=UPI0024AEE94C|nr:SIMPL domain-containing protein [Asticcacaulis sp. EMRT-3]MDI7774301.1 SIMPL domain-containing protein [Asticcacaulis sp. EMRT-3]